MITRTLLRTLAALAALTLTARADDPTPTPSPTPFEAYICSLGTVTGVEDGNYLIATPDGRTIGVKAAGEPTAANVEADIAHPGDELATAKAAKLAEINAAYDAGIAAGSWTTGGDGLQHQLDIGDAAQAEWTKALAILETAQGVLGFDPNTQDATALLGPLLDKSGQSVGSLTVTQFRGIMVSLMSAIGAIRAAKVSHLQALEAAQTVQDVDAIAP
jgi:hypothetical protein